MKEKDPEELYKIIDEEFKFEGEVKNKKQYNCFVIMPLGKEGTNERANNLQVFEKIIKPTVENCGYNIECYHAGLIGEPGSIPEQIITALYNDDIVLADLRRQNSNVIWELGVRHAFLKRSIMICSDYSQIFFDTSVYRVAKYNVDGQSNRDFRTQIEKFINDLIDNPQKPDNPVMHHIPRRLVEISKEPKTDVEMFQLVDYEREQLVTRIKESFENIKDESFDSLWNEFNRIFPYSYNYLLRTESIIKYRNTVWESINKIWEQMLSLNKDHHRSGKYGLINYIFYCLLEIIGASILENGKFALLRTMLETNRLRINGDGIDPLLNWNIQADFIQEKNETEGKAKSPKWIVPRFKYLLDTVNTPDFPLKWDLRTRLIEIDLLYFVFSVKDLDSIYHPWFPCSPVYSEYGAPPFFKKIRHDIKFGAIVANQLFETDYKNLLEILKKAKEIMHNRFSSVYFSSFGAEAVLDEF